MVFIPFYCHNLYSRPHVLTNREKAKREKLPTCNPVQSKVGFTDCWHLWLYRSPTYLLHWPPSLAGLQSTVVKLGGPLVLIWPPHYTVTARLTYSQTKTRASPSGPCTHSGEDWEGEETVLSDRVTSRLTGPHLSTSLSSPAKLQTWAAELRSPSVRSHQWTGLERSHRSLTQSPRPNL